MIVMAGVERVIGLSVGRGGGGGRGFPALDRRGLIPGLKREREVLRMTRNWISK